MLAGPAAEAGPVNMFRFAVAHMMVLRSQDDFQSYAPFNTFPVFTMSDPLSNSPT